MSKFQNLEPAAINIGDRELEYVGQESGFGGYFPHNRLYARVFYDLDSDPGEDAVSFGMRPGEARARSAAALTCPPAIAILHSDLWRPNPIFGLRSTMSLLVDAVRYSGSSCRDLG